ncbi:hypothetical protein [Thermoanaerobacter kivui]|uniref:oxidoreductase n=1 Tax=Thermoanaerobacter kivui TaxID=2325 RepID=UPI002ADE217C|nr:hypothetical protein [Thermoanaerobacter kivui]
MRIRGPIRQRNSAPQGIPHEDIKKWQNIYVKAAVRAYEAGADALEIQFGHGYLIHQFLSPYTNKKEDEYGGSFENRVRFVMEILEEIKKEIGNDSRIGRRDIDFRQS